MESFNTHKARIAREKSKKMVLASEEYKNDILYVNESIDSKDLYNKKLSEKSENLCLQCALF